QRSAVERTFARIDRDFGFEKHYIRGMDKMKARCLISLIIMLTIAYGRTKEGETENIRSLTYSKTA
ncbi:MAG: DDE transposase, partial [Sedimentisphaeraceae bacterium JB056]